MSKIIFYIFLLTLTISNAQAAKFYRFLYKVEPGDSFGLILKKFVKRSSVINKKDPLVQKTFKKNPHVKQWEHLVPGTVIELFISENDMDLNKYKPYKIDIGNKLEGSKNLIKPSYPVGFKGSVFYLNSIGVFNQKANGTDISFKQNSPLSLGGAFSYYPKDELYSVSFSAYLSYLLASSNSLTTDKVSIPLEVGGNVYGEYRLVKNNLTVYSGPDYESFSTFNMQAIENQNKVYVDTVKVSYLTVGVAKAFTLFNKQFFSKFSVSRSIFSTYESNAPQSTTSTSGFIDSGKYSGYKFLFYLNYKFNERLYFHSLFKYHTMSGPSELTVMRVGIGVGYILF